MGPPGLYGPPPGPMQPNRVPARCCGTETGPLPRDREKEMAYQGTGRGEYVLKTSYEYVGTGVGDFSLQSRPEKAYIGCVAGTCCCIILVLPLAWLLFAMFTSWHFSRAPSDASITSAPMAESGPRSTCVLWGDPHVKGFDTPSLTHGLPITFLSNGDYWLVKNDNVWIQGRYEANSWANGFAALHGLAVGGPFLKNNTLLVGPKGGKVYYSNREILTAVPDAFSVPGEITARYREKTVQLDEGTHVHVHSLDLSLQQGVHIVVHRWDVHLDVIITMNQLRQQDGYCGNFNGQEDDDNIQQIRSRFPSEVPRKELLFPPTTFNQDAIRPKAMSDCDAEVLTQAKDKCAAMNRHAGEATYSACIFDVCFQGMEYAAQDSVTVKIAQQLLDSAAARNVA